MMQLNPRTRLPLLLGILLLAFALRMVRVGELRMWGDEAFSVYSAQRPLAAITLEGAENDPHPPLYYYLLHFYMPVAGTSELALRIFSVFSGVAGLALVYALGARLFNPRIGLWATGLGAVAPFHIYYSQEIRMYALAMFLAALGSYFFARLMHHARGSSRALWLAYAGTMLLALYSLYHAAFVLLAQGIFLFAARWRQRALVQRWLVTAASIALLFLPWLVLRFAGTLGHLEDRAGTNIQALPLFAARGFAALTIGTTLPLSETLLLSVGFALVIGLGLGVGLIRRTLTREDVLILALAGIPILAVYPLYLVFPILVARLFALACIPLMIVLARALGRLGRVTGACVTLGLVLLFAYSLKDYYFRFDRYNAAAEDYMPVIHSIEQQARAGDVVLFHANWQIGYFLSHYQGPRLDYRRLDQEPDLEQAVTQPRTVWAVVQDLPLHNSEVWLVQHAFPLGDQQFGKMRVSAFRAGVPTQSEAFNPPLLFDNGMALLGYHLNGESVESGRGRVMLQLDWRAMQAMAEDYTVSVRLTSDHGRTIWAQEDSAPATGTQPTSTWQAGQVIEDRHVLAIPPGTPPGDFDVQVVLYQAGRGSAAQIIAPENQRGETLAAGQINVSRPGTAVAIPGIRDTSVAEWNEVRLVQFEGAPDEIWPGQTLPLTFYWQARTKPSQDYAAIVRLVDAAGAVRGTARFYPSHDTFRASAWNAGEVWTDRVNMDIDAGAAKGEAVLTVSLSTDSGQAVSASLQAPVVLTRVLVRARDHNYQVPVPQNPQLANFGNKIKLLGYDLAASTLKPADTLKLTLYWQARETMRERYTVFVHLLNASGELVAQHDREPQDGQAPTLSWLPGEVIADVYSLAIPPGLASGEYALDIGLYEASQGRRLNLPELAADRLRLGRVRIAAP